MDGNGSIQVNHWKKKNLQFRLVIKLNNTVENIEMLTLIQQVIGGYIRISLKKKLEDYVLWIVDNRKEVERIIQIFDIYPLLTKRKRAQLIFLKEALKRNDVLWYLKGRNHKYAITMTISYEAPYFNEWFSGFVEAEGYFSIRKKGNHSFSISQKYEKSLFTYIHQYFNITTKIREGKNDIFVIEVYKKSVISMFILHFTQYPLLGEKKCSFDLFKSHF